MSSPETGTGNIRIVGAKRYIIAIAVLLTLLGAIFTTVMSASSESVDQANECTVGSANCKSIYQPSQSLLLVPTWTDPFTVTGTTPTVLPGLQSNLNPIGINHPYIPLLLLDVNAKVSAGATCNVVFFFNSTMQGIGLFFTSTVQVQQSAFVAENTTALPIDGVTLVDAEAYCNAPGQTISVYGTDPTGLFLVTYMSIFDLNTDTGTPAVPK